MIIKWFSIILLICYYTVVAFIPIWYIKFKSETKGKENHLLNKKFNQFN